MKNLVKAITVKERKRLEDFILDINKVESKDTFDISGLKTWQYNDLLPKGKDVSNFSFTALKGYLIARKEKQVNKSIEREVNKIKTVFAAGELISVKISVEWKRSKMWGSNPNAECWYTYKKDGNMQSDYVVSGSIGGCGYDKLSTAVADCLNQINEVLRPLYNKKERNAAVDNRELFGYGSGYGIFPYIEGGVGTSCYPAIFEGIGYKFQSVASGKTFDVFEITKH